MSPRKTRLTANLNATVDSQLLTLNETNEDGLKITKKSYKDHKSDKEEDEIDTEDETETGGYELGNASKPDQLKLDNSIGNGEAIKQDDISSGSHQDPKTKNITNTQGLTANQNATVDSKTLNETNDNQLLKNMLIIAGCVLLPCCAAYVLNITHLWNRDVPISTPLLREEFLKRIEEIGQTADLKEFDYFSTLVSLANQTSEISLESVIVTLLHHNNKWTAENIGRLMAAHAATVFHEKNAIFSLNGNELDNSYFPANMRFLKEKVIETGALLVSDFERTSVKAVRHFHEICDKYTPFVNAKAAYILIFGINVELSEGHNIRYLKSVVSDTMKNLWPELMVHEFEPLAVRITETIIPILNKP